MKVKVLIFFILRWVYKSLKYSILQFNSQFTEGVKCKMKSNIFGLSAVFLVNIELSF